MSTKIITKSIWTNPGNRGKRIRKSFAAMGWQLQKHIFGGTRQLVLSNGVRFKAHSDCVTSSALIYGNWPEYWELMFVRSWLRRDDVVLDVGANVGHISLLLADVVGPQNLYAFEPAPVSFSRLVENWRLNGWPDQQLFNVAVGDASGNIYIEDVDRPETTISISNECGSGRSVEIPLSPLDEFRQHWQGKPVGFIKIDVEGYEEAVFRGSHLLLRNDRPRLIMFESLDTTLDEDVRHFLESRSYFIFQLDDCGNPDSDETSKQNLFAAPIEFRDHILKGRAAG